MEASNSLFSDVDNGGADETSVRIEVALRPPLASDEHAEAVSVMDGERVGLPRLRQEDAQESDFSADHSVGPVGAVARTRSVQRSASALGNRTPLL